MKVGVRKPSIKKSVKARTTGKIKRAAKRSVNPLYGKKGMGYLNNPKRAIKNKIYHKVTVDSLASVKHPNESGHASDYDPDFDIDIKQEYSISTIMMGLLSMVSIICFIYATVKLIASDELHLIWYLVGIVSLIIVRILKKNES